MKKVTYYFLICIGIALIYSCETSDDAPQFLQTTVQGQAIDQERNSVYTNDTIILSANYICGQGFTSGGCYEFIASTVTDADGNYEFTFDYDVDKGYTVTRVSQHTYYEQAEELPRIEPGEINTIDFIGWRPIIFKVDVAITNNVFPDLGLNSRDDNNLVTSYPFPFFRIPEENIETTVYLHGKPNTQMSLSFYYTDDNTEYNYHERREVIHTVVQDTISLSYQVDCSTF